jgi:hypothetical protein
MALNLQPPLKSALFIREGGGGEPGRRSDLHSFQTQ